MKKSGFTLVEIMLVIAIVSVISGGMLMVFIRSLHAYYTISTVNELNNSGSLAMDEIARDICQSNMISSFIGLRIDPITGLSRDIMILPVTTVSDPATGVVLWQEAVIYYPFRTADNIDQIRKYRVLGLFADADLPLGAIVTANTINISTNAGVAVAAVDRENGHEKILANFVSTNGPPGTNNFTPIGGSVNVTLFLQKPVTAIGGNADRDVSVQFNNVITWRN